MQRLILTILALITLTDCAAIVRPDIVSGPTVQSLITQKIAYELAKFDPSATIGAPSCPVIVDLNASEQCSITYDGTTISITASRNDGDRFPSVWFASEFLPNRTLERGIVMRALARNGVRGTASCGGDRARIVAVDSQFSCTLHTATGMYVVVLHANALPNSTLVDPISGLSVRPAVARVEAALDAAMRTTPAAVSGKLLEEYYARVYSAEISALMPRVRGRLSCPATVDLQHGGTCTIKYGDYGELPLIFTWSYARPDFALGAYPVDFAATESELTKRRGARVAGVDCPRPAHALLGPDTFRRCDVWSTSGQWTHLYIDVEDPAYGPDYRYAP
jgi:hypothetical protein